jgi:hypothetical protein
MLEAVNFADEDIRKGNFEFWYQWRKNKILATGWRNLRKEVYKHCTFLNWTQDDSKRPHTSQPVILTENTTSGPRNQSGRVAEEKNPYSCYKSNQGFLLFRPIA